MTARRLAAIDIGTVTTRLLVADVTEDSITPVLRSTDITHLGEGLTTTGVLSEEAMARVAGVIGRYADAMAEAGVESFTAIATSASRDADNGERFLDLLAEQGVRPEIIAGDREARLSFLGATYGLEGDGLLVCDLGGGSTELILGDVEIDDGQRVDDIVAARSIDVGSKRLTEMFLKSDPPRDAELDEARVYAVEQLRPYFDRLGERPSVMFAVAGTATTLVTVRDEIDPYDPERVHGACLTGSDLVELLDMLSSMPLEERKQLVGLDPGRAPVIVAGALILETIVGLAGVDSAVVSDHDILHGILVDTWRKLENPSQLAD